VPAHGDQAPDEQKDQQDDQGKNDDREGRHAQRVCRPRAGAASR
jgi:hypothetical protein